MLRKGAADRGATEMRERGGDRRREDRGREDRGREDRGREDRGREGRSRPRGGDDGEWAELLLRTSEVAKLFSVSSRTVREWARRGLLPTIRTPGGQHRFPEGPVRELLHRVRSLSAEAPRGQHHEQGPGTHRAV